jgi:hypothetical protein
LYVVPSVNPVSDALVVLAANGDPDTADHDECGAAEISTSKSSSSLDASVHDTVAVVRVTLEVATPVGGFGGVGPDPAARNAAEHSTAYADEVHESSAASVTPVVTIRSAIVTLLMSPRIVNAASHVGDRSSRKKAPANRSPLSGTLTLPAAADVVDDAAFASSSYADVAATPLYCAQ